MSELIEKKLGLIHDGKLNFPYIRTAIWDVVLLVTTTSTVFSMSVSSAGKGQFLQDWCFLKQLTQF